LHVRSGLVTSPLVSSWLRVGSLPVEIWPMTDIVMTLVKGPRMGSVCSPIDRQYIGRPVLLLCLPSTTRYPSVLVPGSGRCSQPQMKMWTPKVNLICCWLLGLVATSSTLQGPCVLARECLSPACLAVLDRTSPPGLTLCCHPSQKNQTKMTIVKHK